MKPYFEGGGVILGDCLEVLRLLPNAHVNAVVTDPPYMIGARSIGDPKSKAGAWGDLMNASFWYGEWMGECWRVLKDGGYMAIFMNWRSLPMFLKAASGKMIPATSLAVWDKEWIGPAGPSQLRGRYELILFCGKQGAKIANRSQPDLFFHKWMAGNMGETGHPAEKPVALLREILELITNPGALILDPFCGSASTGIAAIETGRHFLGIEIDEKWHALSEQRLAGLKPE